MTCARRPKCGCGNARRGAAQLVSMPWGRSDPYAPAGLLQPVLALLAVLAAGKWDLSRHDPEGDVRGAKITDSLLVLVCCLARDQRVGQQMLAQGVLQSVVKVRQGGRQGDSLC